MAGGEGNPLGARAPLYLGKTLYIRIHGTNSAVDHWHVRIVGMHQVDQPGHYGPLHPRQGWQPRCCAASQAADDRRGINSWPGKISV